MMPAVGSTAIDVFRDVQDRIGKLESVVAAFFRFDARSNRIIVTTLLPDFNHFADEQLSNVEVGLIRAYNDFAFDFETIHLKDRDPYSFVPADASVVVDRLKSLK